MRKLKERKLTHPEVREWMSHGACHRHTDRGVAIPAKYLIIAHDVVSKEDYPLYAEKITDVKMKVTQITKLKQTIRQIVELTY